MHTRGKGRNSLEKQRMPLGAAKCEFLQYTLSREGVRNSHFVRVTAKETECLVKGGCLVKRKIGLIECSAILFLFVLPILCILYEYSFGSYSNLPRVMLKWNVFWGVGMRMFTTGLKQIFSPEFTCKEIFEVEDEKCFAVCRELGFANITMGLCAMISLILKEFLYGGAFLGLTYFGVAIAQHILRSSKNGTEKFVLMADAVAILELLVPMILI